MQRLEVSCAVRLIYTSLGAKGLIHATYLLSKYVVYFNLSTIRVQSQCKIYDAVIFKICTLLGFYVAQNGSFLPTFRNKLSHLGLLDP